MYEWRSHTAEIELAIDAATAEEVFAEAVTAFAELVALDGGDEPVETRDVEIEAHDRPSQLVDWLEELIFLADRDGFLADRAEDVRFIDASVRATLVGRRRPFEPLVKAATYHGLHFARNGDIWQARVVLDV